MKKLIYLIILLFVQIVCASNEIVFTDLQGQTSLYCRVVKGPKFGSSAFYIWNGSAYVQTPSTWALSVITLTEETHVKGLYDANMPTSPAGHYFILFYDNISPADTDEIIGKDEMDWSGTQQNDLTDVVADTNELQTGWSTIKADVSKLYLDGVTNNEWDKYDLATLLVISKVRRS